MLDPGGKKSFYHVGRKDGNLDPGHKKQKLVLGITEIEGNIPNHACPDKEHNRIGSIYKNAL